MTPALVALVLLAPPPGSAFVPVEPVAPSRKPQGAALRLGSGQFFTYALPPGWRVGEDGQFALTLVSPDAKAYSVMVGNAGLPPGYDPARFVHEKLLATRPRDLRLGPPRAGRPVAGFSQAVEFDVTYTAPDGTPRRGVAKANVQRGYDSAVYAMTGAISDAREWAGYATWLPAVADQIAAKNGAAFGVRGIMAQNLRNSTAFAEAAKSYREWSERTWKGVTDAREASQDRIQAGRRENLGAARPYANPYDGTRQPVELPLTHRHYWMDRQGHIVGTDDPTANPNDGSTLEWRRMDAARPQR